MDQEQELTLGEYLKRSREKANFSIEKLSLKTRINANILRSLEAEDFQRLPSPAYLKGFVLSYVKMFSLSDSEAIKKLEDSFHKKTGQKFPSLNHNGPTTTTRATSKLKTSDTDELFNKSDNIIDTTKQFMPYIIGVIIIAASFTGYKVVSSMINKETQSRNEIDTSYDDDVEETQNTQIIPPEPLIVPPPTSAEKTERITPQERLEEAPAPQPKIENKTKKSNKGENRNFPAVDFKPIPDKLYTLKPDAPENNDDSLMPRSYKAKLDTELQNIYIRALDGETWVSYKVDDEAIQNEFIREGKALFLQGKEIRMFFGNVNVTRIFLNNTYVDPQSKTGVKTIVFPQAAGPKFQRPLFVRLASGELITSEEYIQKMNEEDQKIGSP